MFPFLLVLLNGLFLVGIIFYTRRCKQLAEEVKDLQADNNRLLISLQVQIKVLQNSKGV